MRALAVVVSAAAALVPLGPGRAAAGEPAGADCGFASVEWPGSTRQVGELDAGPILLDDDVAAPAASGTVTCRLLVGGWRHVDPAAVTVTSEPGARVVYVPPTRIEYENPGSDDVYLCTRVDVAGRGPLYLDSERDVWSADPYVPCGAAWGNDPDPDPSPGLEPYVDMVVCPVLAVAFPPQGDVPGIWDCPPYES